MVRHFPRAPWGASPDDSNPREVTDRPSLAGRFSRSLRRHRRTIGGAVALMLVATLSSGIVPAQADPKDDKKEVEKKLDSAKEHLDGSTKEFAAATKKFEVAENKMNAAKRKLAKTRGQLAAAQAQDKAMAAKLQSAKKAVADARTSLKRAQRKVEAQQRDIGAVARNKYRESGGLNGLEVVLDSDSIDELMDRSHAVRTVQKYQRQTLEKANSNRAEVASKKAALEAAERAAARQRKEAADNLVAIKKLEQQAADSKAEVQKFFDKRKAAYDDAQAHKAEDEKRYQQLQSERDRIEKKLRERAEQQRRKDDGGGDDGGGSGGGGGGGSGFIHPVNAPITSPYGMRLHPVTGVYKLHDGTDFGAGCGAPIKAAASGTVIEAYFNAGYGNRVLVDHGGGVVTAYNHMNSSASVGVGSHVNQGQTVGYVGTTGYSTGCHLHFMVYKNGSTQNPMNYL